jgi:hypothetical protein
VTTWKELIEKDEKLVINSFVLTVVHALMQNRLGLEAVKDFKECIYTGLGLLFTIMV